MSDLIDGELILAAEDFAPNEFREVHVFTAYEERIIRKLTAHGPVLLRGGRGSGKSALLREASFRLNAHPLSQTALGVYLSLRHLPLLRSKGSEYESVFCRLLTRQVNQTLSEMGCEDGIATDGDIASTSHHLVDQARRLDRRIVLIFDDAAHIGREASLEEFFGIFRTLSSSYISCKAAIYPGVTHFGRRFDVYNDATVVDIVRNEESDSFAPFFRDVLQRRFGSAMNDGRLSEGLTLDQVAGFVGKAVIGNVRAYISVWQALIDQTDHPTAGRIGLPQLSKTFVQVAQDYFWPLFEELRPKLGMYEPLVDPAMELAETLYQAVAKHDGKRSAIVHRDYVEKLSRLFEILEYVGFVGRRDASRAMKSGGRGTRFVMNLCNLLEEVRTSRLTRELFTRWDTQDTDPVELHHGSDLGKISQPSVNTETEPSILQKPIETLAKSKAYPYGLTEQKILVLKDAGFSTVGQIALADDQQLDDVWSIGERWVNRIRNTVAQAIWM